MSKIIIAICGPSASGKDYLAEVLYENKVFENANKIVRDTTRPPRINEKDGREYNFIDSNVAFLKKACNGEYLEYSKYRNWYYGSDKDQIKEGINIGVFDRKSLEKLMTAKGCLVIPIYCKCGLKLRMRRSYYREKKFKLEYLRRAFSDYFDYRKIKKILPQFPNYKILDVEHLFMKECLAVIKIFIDFAVIW